MKIVVVVGMMVATMMVSPVILPAVLFVAMGLACAGKGSVEEFEEVNVVEAVEDVYDEVFNRVEANEEDGVVVVRVEEVHVEVKAVKVVVNGKESTKYERAEEVNVVAVNVVVPETDMHEYVEAAGAAAGEEAVGKMMSEEEAWKHEAEFDWAVYDEYVEAEEPEVEADEDEEEDDYDEYLPEQYERVEVGGEPRVALKRKYVRSMYSYCAESKRSAVRYHYSNVNYVRELPAGGKFELLKQPHASYVNVVAGEMRLAYMKGLVSKKNLCKFAEDAGKVDAFINYLRIVYESGINAEFFEEDCDMLVSMHEEVVGLRLYDYAFNYSRWKFHNDETGKFEEKFPGKTYEDLFWELAEAAGYEPED